MAHKVIQGVYKVVNTTNGHFYVGSSNSILRRWYEHRRLLRLRIHPNPILQAAWDKYGPGAFQAILVEEVGDRSDLLLREAHYIEALRPQYNINLVEEGRITHKHTPEAKEKIRQAMLGRKHSDETRLVMSASAKARGMSEHLRAQQRAAVTGKPRPPEVRAKIASAHLGMSPSPETRAKISLSLTNRNRAASIAYAVPSASPASNYSATHQEPGSGGKRDGEIESP